MTYAIDIRELRKTYRRNWATPPFEALKGISLTVEEGEVFGFIGPNGAGKSTAIKILTGVMLPTAGSAALFGVDVTHPEARRGLGYVPENPSLPDYLNPLEILSMGLALHRRKPANVRLHCLHWLERFDLADVANKVVRGFSKGMAQRTALAHAMAVEPRLLILDEPLSGLDPIGRRDVVDILSEYRQRGGSIFLTSHVLHDVERLADRFGLIHKGELRAVRAPGELAGEEERVLVRSQGRAAVPGMSAEPGERWVIELARSQLWPTLRAIEEAGHTVIEIKPSLSLETAFLHVVKGD
ncbi:MAG: ABC transporter ATP-binding protein [Sulfuritalea sp.]|jgi:ABC-2 type transport system ATP-binding protein|nr:ABC transporter ATP-binding protein [Sulfuritalea sp.]